MIKDFKTYINEGLFDRNQSEFAIRKTDRGVEHVYIPSTKEELYSYIDIAIENAKKDGTYPNVNLNNIDVSELGNDELDVLFSDKIYMINPDISNWNIKYIPQNFFDGNKQIKEFTISNSVTSIGDWAFNACSELTSVTIPNSVINIGEQAFYDCSKLKSITIPNSVTSIGYGAFRDCSGLTSVKIPNSVTSIGESAFYNCSGLTSITIGNSVTSIGEEAFRGCSGLTSIVVESGNTTYDSRNGCNAIIETATNALVVGCQSTIIPNNVTSIGMYAFEGCSGLTSVTIPNSVTSIGEGAFKDCSKLTSVTIPNSVNNIEWTAFEGCRNLKYVTISNNCRVESKSFPKDCTIIRK